MQVRMCLAEVLSRISHAGKISVAEVPSRIRHAGSAGDGPVDGQGTVSRRRERYFMLK